MTGGRGLILGQNCVTSFMKAPNVNFQYIWELGQWIDVTWTAYCSQFTKVAHTSYVVEGNRFQKYSNHLNTEHLSTGFFWILDSMAVRYSNCNVMWLGRQFEYRTFWTINRIFSVRFSDHHSSTGPFDNWTQIYLMNTRLVRYSDSYCTLNPLWTIPKGFSPKIFLEYW